MALTLRIPDSQLRVWAGASDAICRQVRITTSSTPVLDIRRVLSKPPRRTCFPLVLLIFVTPPHPRPTSSACVGSEPPMTGRSRTCLSGAPAATLAPLLTRLPGSLGLFLVVRDTAHSARLAKPPVRSHVRLITQVIVILIETFSIHKMRPVLPVRVLLVLSWTTPPRIIRRRAEVLSETSRVSSFRHCRLPGRLPLSPPGAKMLIARASRDPQIDAKPPASFVPTVLLPRRARQCNQALRSSLC
mmetsp:Transcript_35535/g.100590  ORF Transcript_35535/g.100590 Transcript_35535/m.100590 type:complete len:245 (-) Transcript_35535:727-1461(-)